MRNLLLLLLFPAYFLIVTGAEEVLATIVHISEADVQHPDLDDINDLRVSIIPARKKWGFVLGLWTILPLLNRIHEEHKRTGTKSNWYIFVQDETRLDLTKLLKFLEAEALNTDDVPTRYLNAHLSKPRFFGFAQVDDAPTILHHYAANRLNYPLLSAGIAINSALFNSLLVHNLKETDQRSRRPDIHAFTIDAAFEFAKFALEASGALLENRSSVFCLHESQDCATWTDQVALFCPKLRRSANDSTYRCDVEDPLLSLDNIFFAVKTCERYHQERVRGVLSRTWIPDVRHFNYYAEFGHPDHVVNVQVTNVLQGHCRKTMRIFEMAQIRIQKHNSRFGKDSKDRLKWLVLADDDTLVNASALVRLLRHFDPDRDSVLVGERYGFGMHDQYGFDYPTGGAGIAISLPALAAIREKTQCVCAKNDEPDDMRIGECTFGSPQFRFVHSMLFHQNRPFDYSALHRSLVRSRAVSFHRAAPAEAIEDYQQWLRPSGPLREDVRTEATFQMDDPPKTGRKQEL